MSQSYKICKVTNYQTTKTDKHTTKKFINPLLDKCKVFLTKYFWTIVGHATQYAILKFYLKFLLVFFETNFEKEPTN